MLPTASSRLVAADCLLLSLVADLLASHSSFVCRLLTTGLTTRPTTRLTTGLLLTSADPLRTTYYLLLTAYYWHATHFADPLRTYYYLLLLTTYYLLLACYSLRRSLSDLLLLTTTYYLLLTSGLLLTSQIPCGLGAVAGIALLLAG